MLEAGAPAFLPCGGCRVFGKLRTSASQVALKQGARFVACIHRGQRLRKSGTPFAEMRAQVPEPSECAGEPQCAVRINTLQMIERGAQVVVLLRRPRFACYRAVSGSSPLLEMIGAAAGDVKYRMSARAASGSRAVLEMPAEKTVTR